MSYGARFLVAQRLLFLSLASAALALGCAKDDSSSSLDQNTDSGAANSDASTDSGQGGAAGSDAGSDAQAGQGGGSAGDSGSGGSAGEAGSGGSGGDSGSGGSAGSDAGAGCEKHWTREICPSVGSNATVKAEIVGGMLNLEELNAPYLCGTISPPQLPLKLYQDGLSGDFDVSFSFQDFSAGANDAALQAYIYDSADNTKIADLTIAKANSGNKLSASLQSGATPQEDKKTVSANKGVFKFTRLGSLLTVTATTSDGTATVGSVFSSGTLRIGIGLRGPFTEPNPAVATKVSVSEFAIAKGAASVKADTFDCNSIF